MSIRLELCHKVADKIEPRRNPLAMYYFGKDKSEQEYLLSHVQSGGVGASGMGAYHGPEGFRNMSHARAMYSQSMIDVLPIIGACPLTVVPAYRLFFRRRQWPVDDFAQRLQKQAFANSKATIQNNNCS